MKKFMKNTLVTFVIVYTILNLVFYIFSIISRYCMINDFINQYIGENIDVQASIEIEKNAKESAESMKNIYGENVPVTELMIFQSYSMGMSAITDVQTMLLIVSIILSIAIGIILSLTEKSKAKELLHFITVGLSLVLLYTIIMYITGEYEGFNIFEAIIETINSCGIYYIIAYLVKIIYTYYKNIKSVKELNKEIEKKNK